jgi:uroporphyrin-III C-methyltransferase
MSGVAGKVYLVGAGPGAPDLITVRAARVLAEADIVFHDALVHPDTIALAVRAKKVAVGKRCGGLATAQRFINKRLVDAARCYRTVVRLKGGDPMLFGRAQEEISALSRAGIEYEVIPGVTAALGAAAEAGISLTQRGIARSVAVLTPRVGEGQSQSDWVKCAIAADTAVLYMAAGQASEIADALIAQGRSPDTPLVVVENATLPGARRFFIRLLQLPSIATFGIEGPALIMLGAVFAQGVAASDESLQAFPIENETRYNSSF